MYIYFFKNVHLYNNLYSDVSKNTIQSGWGSLLLLLKWGLLVTLR